MRPAHDSPSEFSMNLQSHLDELDEKGFTLIPNQLTPAQVTELGRLSVRASDRYIEEWRNGLDLREVTINPRPNFDETPNARALYLWGDAVLDLLDHDTIHAIAGAAMPDAVHLNDVVTNVVRRRKMPARRKWGFHRDYAPGLDADGRHRYLWFFFLLNDFTEENGATWVVPGSHRVETDDLTMPEENELDDPFPGKVRALGSAGDLFVLNSSTLHSAGENRTDEARKTMNVRLTCADGVMVSNHWEVAGPGIQKRVSERVARLMQPNQTPDLKTDWLVRPEPLAA